LLHLASENNSSMLKMNFEKAVCTSIIALIFSSCGDKKQAMTIVPDVNVVAAVQRDIPVFSEFVGQTYGQSDIELQPRVEGWITAIHFKEGEMVKKGQLLYTIDDIQLQNKVASASANVAEARVMVEKTKADLDRVEPLAAMNALSKRDLDAAVASYKAQLENLASAQALYSNANVELGYSRIISPIDGIIGVSKVQPGDYVSRSTVKNVINTISAVGAMRVRFSITENDYLEYKKKAAEGMTADKMEIEMILSDGTVYPEKGKLDFADRSIDAMTGSLLVQAVFQNSDRTLRPGQYVKVRFVSDMQKGAILVPQQAINQMQNIYRVFVVNDSSMIVPRAVKVGVRTGSNWVITEGLKAGEKVAMVGNAIIKPGIPVKPIDMSWNYDSTLVK
jgi:membrane fusion protein (multidrug efflux system)